MLDGPTPRLIKDVFAWTAVRAAKPGLTVGEIAGRLVVGGWPGNLSNTIPQLTRAVRDYLEEIRRMDVRRVDDRARDPIKVGWLLRSLARNVSTEATIAILSVDADGADGELERDTVSDYLSALERLMIVEDQPIGNRL